MGFNMSILPGYRERAVSQSHEKSRAGKWAMALALCALVAVPGAGNAAPAPDTNSVLILGTTVVDPGGGILEELQASALGLTPVVVDAATWGGMTAAHFATYRALILGDPNCEFDTVPLTAAVANREVWSAQITGNIVILGTDPAWHVTIGSDPAALTLMNQSINFAADPLGPLKTGLYISLSCYYAGAFPGTPVDVLDQFSGGVFNVQGGSSNLEKIVAVSPVLGALTDADLSGWDISSHESFTAWPGDFDVLAISTDVGVENYIAEDLTAGAPYILARGALTPPTLTLTPESAYNPIGTTHVLEATIAGVPKRCAESEGFGVCTTDADCPSVAFPLGVAGSCTYAGYPTFFAVVGLCNDGVDDGEICTDNTQCTTPGVCDGGPNLGDFGLDTTDGTGVATASYSSAEESVDIIMACLDGDPSAFGIDDDSGEFIECFNDAPPDIPSNEVTKGWFANFITGGAGTYATANKRKTMQFSGVIGKDSDQPGIHGQWNATAKDGSTGKTVSCHFDTFTSLVFGGPPATKPASTHNTATWTTGPGKCNDGSTPILTAIAVDYGEGKKLPRDTINVSGDSRFDTGGTKNLTTGNLQVHSIILP